MSFTSDVKQEITLSKEHSREIRSELSSFLHINANLLIVNKTMQLEIETSNASVAKYFFTVIKERYGVEVDLKVYKNQRFKKNNIYTLRVLDKAIEILEDVGIYSSKGMRETPYSMMVVKEDSAKGYLAGAFLASGSLNSPTSINYHLEITTHTLALAQFIEKVMVKFELEAKVTERRGKYVVYLKKADQIADFLKIVGAYENTMLFEDIRIQRDFRNSLTRLDNCEVANEVKSIQAGSKQLDAIYKLINFNRYNYLDPKLIEVAEIRMDNPEGSLNELVDKYQEEYNKPISKSGLQHRLKKIIQLAETIEES